MRYENLKYSDHILPIIFRQDSREPGVSMYMHWHEAVEILLIRQGKMHIVSNSHSAVVSEGQLVCVHSGHLHSYTALEGRCEYYCVILPAEALDWQDLYKSPLPLVSNSTQAAALMEKLAQIMEQCQPFYKEEARAVLAQLYVTLVRQGGGEVVGNERRMTVAVKQAIEYIGVHYAEELQVEQVAAAVGVSSYHLCHIFKAATGHTVSHYWQSVRCDKARAALRKGASVAEAAEQCGFSSPAYFTKVYQKHFSVLPSEDKM